MSVLDELNFDFHAVAITMVKLGGTAPEYMDVVEVVNDSLEDRGYDLNDFTTDELEEISRHVYDLCSKAQVTIP